MRTPCTAAALAVLCACSGGTTLFLEVDTSQVAGVEQLHLTGRVGEALVFGPAVRPERPEGVLGPKESVRVLLPDDVAESEVWVVVEGLSDGRVRSSAQARVQPERGRETTVALVLLPGASACPDCDGCCDGARCVSPSVSACGAGGVACFACDPVLADACGPGGRCQCGEGVVCHPDRGADRCVDGECRCGEGPACAAGTRCDNGICRCAPETCAGCCSGNECLPGTATSACGSGGAACRACATAESCSAGACQ